MEKANSVCFQVSIELSVAACQRYAVWRWTTRSGLNHWYRWGGTEPLICVREDELNQSYMIFNPFLFQLFVTYGNRLANQVWAPAVPAGQQLRPESSDEERSTFIQDKYSRGRYRRVHALASSRSLMDQVWVFYSHRLMYVDYIYRCVLQDSYSLYVLVVHIVHSFDDVKTYFITCMNIFVTIQKYFHTCFGLNTREAN